VTATSTPTIDESELRRIRRKPWGSIVLAVVLGFCTLSLAVNMGTNPRWEWDVVAKYLFDPRILQGLGTTIVLTLTSGVCGIVVGIVLALMRLSSVAFVRMVAGAYVGFTRAVPALVLLLFIYYASALFPVIAIGIPFGPTWFEIETNSVISQFTAACLGLTIILGAHLGEIFRGGIMSVDRGQLEAARALGMKPVQAFTRIVAPQAVRVAVPGAANELVSLFKNTSLVSIIGFAELLTVVQFIYGTTFQTIPLLLVACIWYAALTTIAMVLQRRLEKRLGRGH